jgi:signal transduction histidine kinase
MFKDKLQFSRERLEFFYSILILVTIPVLLVANTILLSISVRNNFDTELRRKADMANSLIASVAQTSLADQSKLQQEVDQFKAAGEDLEEIIIAQPVAGSNKFTIVAASSKNQVGKDTNDLQLQIAATRKQSIAQLVKDSTGRRYWSVLRPVVKDGQVLAVVGSTVSLEHADALIGNTLLRSLAILTVMVIVIILLLLNHFRFVQYAQLFRKLQEVDQLKNDFLSVATHELRAPMTVIKGNISNLLDGIGGIMDNQAKSTLADMYTETERLNSMVNDLLNVSRIEQGRITYDMAVVDAREIIEKVVTNFHDKAVQKGLTLAYEKPEAPALINVDSGRLTEIMTNLVDNAIKYSRQGTVTVTHKPADKKVRISVRDTGIGMNAAARERLFDRFYRVQNEQTKDIPGTGLGLWIIKQYIEHMNGTITVDSLENVGTEFIVEFPQASS